MINKKTSLLLFIVIFTLSAGIILSEETKSWIGSYSSEDWETGDPPEVEKKIYYHWQIDSLKKSVSPRYIRLLDIHKYAETGDILNKGVLFTFSGLHNNSVSICGNFLQWQCKEMRKNRFGIFYILIPPIALNNNYELLLNYRYKFLVDGMYIQDPSNEFVELDESGSQLSVFVLDEMEIDTMIATAVLEDSPTEEFNLRTVRFRIKLPDKNTVSLIGDFNNWNFDSDYMNKMPNGTFELELKLIPGTYYYNYVADGEVLTDLMNPNIKLRMPFEDKVSELVVPKRSYPIEKKF